MKKIKIYLLVGVIFVILTGCSNGFAQKEYNAIDKIVGTEDRYAKEGSVFNPIDNGYLLKAAKFDGRETLWTKTLVNNKYIEIKIKLRLSEGTAKLVHIDEDGNVSTIIECTQDNASDEYILKTISLKKGLNRIRIVGYGCKNIDVELLSSEFEQ